MSARLIQYGFTAGVISDNLWGQSILQKYGFGLDYAQNYVLLHTGSAVSRPGMMHDVLLPGQGANSILFPFVFARESANTFEVYITAGKAYFLQEGFYQLEDSKAIVTASTTAGETSLEVTAHGYSAGDLIEFYGTNVPDTVEGETFKVSSVTDADNFKVESLYSGVTDLDNWAASGSMTAHKVYELTLPYTDAEIANLRLEQARDVINITSLDTAPAQIKRESDGTWSFTVVERTVGGTAPTGLAVDTVFAAGSYGVGFIVTSVNAEGEESLPSNFLPALALANYASVQGGVSIEWDTVADAVSYNVYRTRIVTQNSVTLALQFGYVGEAYAPRFADTNITPDFTKTFPQAFDPFAEAAVESVTVTAGGTGYDRTDTLVVTDADGSGAKLMPIVDGGVIIGVIILDPGRDYTSPSITVQDSAGGASAGSGATFTIDLTGTGAEYPLLSAYHKQRQLYAATARYPLRFWGSQATLFFNFTTSRVVSANESYEYDLDTKILGYIRHIVSTKAGLLVFTDVGLWLVRGSNGAISPIDVDATPETRVGCSDLPPLEIDSDILYAEPNNRRVRLLSYNNFSRQFGGTDISTLSLDLLKREIISWCYTPRPYYAMWGAVKNGTMLSLAVSVEQESFPWAPHKTDGKVKSVISVPEDAREVNYMVVDRLDKNNNIYRSLEHFADREASTNYDHAGVDEGWAFGFNKPAANITVFDYDVEDGVRVVADAAVFTAGDVGSRVRIGKTFAVVLTFTSTTEVVCKLLEAWQDETELPYYEYEQGNWTLDALKTSVTLPMNLRNATTVTVFGDGDVVELTPNSAGVVTFPIQFSAGYIGRKFTAYAKGLPLTADGVIIEASRAKIQRVGLRIVMSKGIYVGSDADDVELLDVDDNPVTENGKVLTTKFSDTWVPSDYVEDSAFYWEANGAYPTEVCSVVMEVIIGDELDGD